MLGLRPILIRQGPHRSWRQITSSAKVSGVNVRSKPSPLRTGFVGATSLVIGGALVLYYADSRSAVHQYVFAPLLRTTLDGELAHKLALLVLRSGLAPRDQVDDDAALQVQIWDKTLTNPIGLAAGFDKNGEAIDGLYNLGFGWVEIGSVTPQPQAGNPGPRVFHLSEDQAVINRYGFPSKGATSVLSRLHARFPYPFSSKDATNLALSGEPDIPTSPASLQDGKLLSVNLGKNKSSSPDSIADFLHGLHTFAAVSDVLVVNVSSPNTPGLRNLQSRGLLIELLGALVKERDYVCSHSKRFPRLVVKIAPDLSKEELEDVAEAVLTTGIDGVIVSNTTIQRPPGLKSKNRNESGGLSGPPLKPLALQAMRTLRGLLPASTPLIGCGGISTGQDAIEWAKAGATTVQLYTSFSHSGVGTPRRIKDEVSRILHSEGKTWMDVVREGQMHALQPTPEKPKDDGADKVKLTDRGGKVLAAGEELLGILKTNVADSVTPSSTTPKEKTLPVD